MNLAFTIGTSSASVLEPSVRMVAAIGAYFGWWEWRLLLIPPITGIIGYITNWVAIRMLFYPLNFRGVDVPGLEALTAKFPYQIRQLPGMTEGRLGWQGIVPQRARKLGSINVDTTIGRLATQEEVFKAFDPDRLADHIYEASHEDIKEMVVENLRQQNPEMWEDSPEELADMIGSQIDQELPAIFQDLTQQMGTHIDDLMDTKLMIIDFLDEHPEYVNEIMIDAGGEEMDFVINAGFYFGTLFGIVSIPAYVFIGEWWVLPVTGVIVGTATNWVALNMIFRPLYPIDIGPFTLHGIFLRSQDATSETYSAIVAREVITLENIADNLLNGPKADRTRYLIKDTLTSSFDEMFGPNSAMVDMIGGPEAYESFREEIAEYGVENAIDPLQDPDINAARSDAVEELLASRLKELPPEQYEQMFHPVFEEDEWLLVALGSVLGFAAGWVQLIVVTSV